MTESHHIAKSHPAHGGDTLGDIVASLPTPEGTQYPYELVVVEGTMAFVAGQIPKRDGKLAFVGPVGRALTGDAAHDAARICAQQVLAWLNRSAGGLGNLGRILRMTCYVAHDDSFNDISAVADGASTYLIRTLGEQGRHARSVIGVRSLPRNAPVLIEVTAALRHPMPL